MWQITNTQMFFSRMKSRRCWRRWFRKLTSCDRRKWAWFFCHLNLNTGKLWIQCKGNDKLLFFFIYNKFLVDICKTKKRNSYRRLVILHCEIFNSFFLVMACSFLILMNYLFSLWLQVSFRVIIIGMKSQWIHETLMK